LASIRAMMVGWDEIEVPHRDEAEFTGPTQEESI
jgi:hypothetical protein